MGFSHKSQPLKLPLQICKIQKQLISKSIEAINISARKTYLKKL